MRDSRWFFSRNDGALRRGRVRIVGTLGPACRDEGRLYEMLLAGMTVARLHSAYADHAEHKENIERLRNASLRAGIPVAILQDLAGAKVRVTTPGHQSIRLVRGDVFQLHASRASLSRKAPGAVFNHREILETVEPNDVVLLSDGAMRLRCLRVSSALLECRVEQGGLLQSHQAVHVPGKSFPIAVPTEQDRRDVAFGVAHGVDWVAQSFISSPVEIQSLRTWIQKQKADLPIIAKIERREAFQCLASLVQVSDGVMVARGDLGLHYPLETVTILQKEIIRCARALRKPVVTATEMLFSMMQSPMPTRAEVSDITNAVMDGTDAIMLSGETGVGRHPVEAVQMAAKISQKALQYVQSCRSSCVDMDAFENLLLS